MKRLTTLAFLAFFLMFSISVFAACYTFDYTDQATCELHTECKWNFPYCNEIGCWDYQDQTACAAASGCTWKTNTNNFCMEGAACWNYKTQDACTAISGCLWNSGGSYCYKPGCWDYTTTETCPSGCTWVESSGWCQQGTSTYCWNYNTEGDCNGGTNCEWGGSSCYETGCWNYYDQTTCDADASGYENCQWSNSSWCNQQGCWAYDTAEECAAGNITGRWCIWENEYCSEINCWTYDYNQTGCTAAIAAGLNCTWSNPYCNKNYCSNYNNDQTGCEARPDCRWDGSWCSDIGCWDFHDQTTCDANTTFACEWQNSTWCTEVSCSQYDGTDNATCEGSGLDCTWNPASYSGNVSTGWCNMKGCWNYYDQTACAADTNCEWTSSGSGWCQDGQKCWNYDWTNESMCLHTGDQADAHTLNCTWDATNHKCNEKGCWNYMTEGTCEAGGCTWGSDNWGWCEKLDCWSFDNDFERCTNASTNASLNNINCQWQAMDANDNTTGSPGWCFKAVAGNCNDYDYNEKGCFDTMYCWYNFTNSKCIAPTGAQEFKGKNPECWIFDNQEVACNATNHTSGVGTCTWNPSTQTCANNPANTSITANGLQCSGIYNSTICNNIPALMSCCKWQAGACVADTFSTTCWDNMAKVPVGASFCEDYNAINNKTNCELIAGDPWYMPCKWDNTTSPAKCRFKFDSMFTGGKVGTFKDIRSKKQCEAAGGTWKTCPYCDVDGNGKSDEWCEMDFGVSKESCDNACFACEYAQGGTAWTTEAEARAACVASNLGTCEWTTDTHAPNGLGWCKYPEKMKKVQADCKDSCWACEMKSDPQAACKASAAKCKWITDPSNPTIGKCEPGYQKGCTEDCFACGSQTDCTTYGLNVTGKCKWDNGMCKPANFTGEVCFDGVDNDNDMLVDCADYDCTYDPFCGIGSMTTCWVYTNEATCTPAGCVWVQDKWGGAWCGVPGSDCFLYDTNSTQCNDQNQACVWKTNERCDFNKSAMNPCFNKNSKATCDADSNCKWQADQYSPSGGWCDYKLFECNWNQTLQTESECNKKSYCKWRSDPYGSRCEPVCFSLTTNTSCSNNTYCSWGGGWCEMNATNSAGGTGVGGGDVGGMMNNADCWMYEANQTYCNEQSACEWVTFSTMQGGMSGGMMNDHCEVDFTAQCGQFNQTGCIAKGNSTCVWVTDQNGWSWCDNPAFECGFNQTKQESEGACEVNTSSNFTCVWIDDTWGTRCDNPCFAAGTNQATCTGTAGCKWKTGMCQPKMMNQMFQGMEQGMPQPLGFDAIGDATPPMADIMGFGIKDNPDKFGLGIGIGSSMGQGGGMGQQTGAFALGQAAICNGEYLMDGTQGSGKNVTKFYWYLDTDGSMTGGCNAVGVSQNYAGYEFMLKYEGSFADGGKKEVLTVSKCVNSAWTATNIRLTASKDKICREYGAGFVLLEKQDIITLSSLYDPTKPMRIFVTTANSTGSRTSPADQAGPEYYTSGSVDFKFENCMAPGQDADGDGIVSDQDPDCEMYNRFGYVPAEDCKSPEDDDGDGLTNCDDNDCMYDAFFCPNSGYNFSNPNPNDKTPPVITLLDISTYPDEAFISYDTNEPANGTVLFYSNDSTGSLLNATIRDPGITDVDVKDYRNQHDGPLNNRSTVDDQIGWNLTNNTTYFYKVKVCDPADNCAISGLMNFTTAYNTSPAYCPECYSTVKFDYAAATGAAATDALGNISVSYDLNNDGEYETVQGNNNCSLKNAGIRVMYNESNNINMKIENPSSVDPWAIEMKGIDIKGKINTDVTNMSGQDDLRFNSTDSGKYVGMGHDTYDRMLSQFRPKNGTVMTIPGSSEELWSCHDDLSNCTEMTDYATMEYHTGAASTTWYIPANASHFSVFGGAQYVAPTTSPGTTPPGGPGGGGAGGGGGASGISILCDENNSKATISIRSIDAGKEKYVNTNCLGLRQINITAAKDIKNTKDAKFYITKTSQVDVTEPQGDVYTYYNIEPVNITDSYITNMKLTYEVAKSWIAEKDVDESSIKMQRYTTAWKLLPTSKLKETADEITFTSATPGFSYFAITGLATGEEYTAPEEVVPETPEGGAETTSVSNTMLAGLGLIIILGLAYVLYSRRKKARHAHHHA